MKKYISTLGIAALSLSAHAATLPFSHDFSSGWGDLSVVDGNEDGTKFILSQYMGYNYTQGASY
ncbi:MAG: hypothetical protein K2L75_08305, partial [Muribaculaceae bacterium]|nr:hypothetical protein [Muribaculaceae bacterium]